MTNNQLEIIRITLATERVRLAAFSPEFEPNTRGDLVDQYHSTERMTLSASVASSRGRQVKAISIALSRLESGEYGTCSACGEEINERRLQALPWALHCLTCQDEFESDHSQLLATP